MLSGEFEQRGCDDFKIFDMTMKKIAKSDKRSACFNVCWRVCLLDGLQPVLAMFDDLWSKCETQIGDFLVAEEAFV